MQHVAKKMFFFVKAGELCQRHANNLDIGMHETCVYTFEKLTYVEYFPLSVYKFLAKHVGSEMFHCIGMSVGLNCIQIIL